MGEQQGLKPNEARHLTGLTSPEVAARRAAGQDNSYVANPSKSNWDIIRGNTFTLFNVTNFIIAAAVLAIRSYANALFIGLIISNIFLGIVVELRARRIVDRLNLLNTDPVRVLRDGAEVRVAPGELVLGDVLRLSAGEQVPSDAVVVSGYVEADEALLTGESDLVEKSAGLGGAGAGAGLGGAGGSAAGVDSAGMGAGAGTGSHLLSGSFIASGQCYATVEHVGADNYSTQLAIEAKQYRPIESELMRALGVVMKFVSWIALPLGALLILQALFLTHVGVDVAILSTSAAVLGMIPRGMAILIAVTLVTGVVKLGNRNVLVQEMYAIETMAHVDTLCLDKTGTITRGVMHVEGFEALGGHTEAAARELLATYLAASTDAGTTMQALREHFLGEGECVQTSKSAPGAGGIEGVGDTIVGAMSLSPAGREATEALVTASSSIPFSSQRKWGAIEFPVTGTDKRKSTLILGAPERLLCMDALPPSIAAAQEQGYRALLLGVTPDHLAKDGNLTAQVNITPVACITLDDPVRDSAPQTLDYLREQGVELKIISGDNPVTVSKIAAKAGFENYGRYVDASRLTDEELVAATPDTAIFGRVSPQQKRLIVSTLRDAGKTVGMTGDGVNDILAMREANLSMAMSTGDPATKQIANLVLLNSDFADVPEIMFEARRVVNNMLRSASIFFVKTIYSAFLVIFSALSAFTPAALFMFPFMTIQITLADQTVGWPSLWLSFQSDRTPVAKGFLKTALYRSVPNAVLITASIIFIHYYGIAQGWSATESVTLMYCMLGVFTFLNVVRACLPPSIIHILLILATAIGYYGAMVLLGPYVGLGALTENTARMFVILTTGGTALWLGYQQFYKHVLKLP